MVNCTLPDSPHTLPSPRGERGCEAAYARHVKCYTENCKQGAMVSMNANKTCISFKHLFGYTISVWKKFGESQFQICFLIVFLSKGFYCSNTERKPLRTIFKYMDASFGILKIQMLLILVSNVSHIPTEACRTWLYVCVCTPTDPHGIKTHNQIIYEQCIL